MTIDFDFEAEIGIQTEEEIDQELDANLTAQGVELQNNSFYGVFWRGIKICVVAASLALQKFQVVVAQGSFWEKGSGNWLKLRAPEFGVTETEGKTDEEIRAEGKAKIGRQGVWKASLVYQVIANDATGIPIDYIFVDDNHPRGQGTVDIYVTNESGLPEQSVLDAASDYIVTQGNRGIGDNVKVMFPPLATIDIHVKVVLYDDQGEIDDVTNQVDSVIKAKFRQNTLYTDATKVARVVNRVHLKRDLVLSDLIADLEVLVSPKKEIEIITPADTVEVGLELPVLGTLTIDAVRESDDI